MEDTATNVTVVAEEGDAPAPRKSWYRRMCEADPDFKENYRTTNRAYYIARRERDPAAFKAARNADWVNRYRNDPVFRAKNVESSRAYRARKKAERQVLEAESGCKCCSKCNHPLKDCDASQ